VSNATFSVRAKVMAGKPLSLIPPDPVERGVSLPVSLSMKLYRPGFLYSLPVVLRQRLGVENFWGSFQSKDGTIPPVRLDGQPLTALMIAK
jgi:hypothetical protein